MSMRRLGIWRAAVLPLAFVASAATVNAQGHVTSPKEFFTFSGVFLGIQMV